MHAAWLHGLRSHEVHVTALHVCSTVYLCTGVYTYLQGRSVWSCHSIFFLSFFIRVDLSETIKNRVKNIFGESSLLGMNYYLLLRFATFWKADLRHLLWSNRLYMWESGRVAHLFPALHVRVAFLRSPVSRPCPLAAHARYIYTVLTTPAIGSGQLGRRIQAAH